MVEGEAKTALDPAEIEVLGSVQARLLGDREEQLERHRRLPTVLGQQPGQLEHRRDRRLVVGPEDAIGRVLPATVAAHRLEQRRQRHGVQMRAEQQRLWATLHAVGATPRDPGQEVAGLRACGRGAVVLLHLDAERRELVDHPVGDHPLGSGLTRNTAQLLEGAVQTLTRLRVQIAHPRTVGFGAAALEALTLPGSPRPHRSPRATQRPPQATRPVPHARGVPGRRRRTHETAALDGRGGI